MTSTAPALVDSHCHLNYKGLEDDIDGVLSRAAARGVEAMVAINARLSEYDEVLRIAERSERIFATVGSHPHEADKEPDIALGDLLSRAEHPKIVAIGETGLDYHYEFAPREAQKANFRTHLTAARETGLPVIVHARDADADAYDLIAEAAGEGDLTGVLHCFTAGAEFARQALDLGFYVSFSGILTFQTADNIREVAKFVPEDRLLVETDAPYLSPVPNRGKRCEPAFVADTAACLAEVRGVPLEAIAEQTTENFYRLFSKARRPGS